MKTYIIEYTMFRTGGNIKTGKMRSKNRINEFDAKVKFEAWLRKTNPDFQSLTIHSCKEDDALQTIMDKIFGKGMFGR